MNFAKHEAIEMSIRNKAATELNFDALPDTFTKILLTKDQDFVQRNGLIRVPYYKFIFEHSVGKELLPEKGFVSSHKRNHPKVKFDMTDD